MAKFIPIEKIKKLRESAKAGDEKAKAILRKQMLGEEDFSAELEEYFKPVEEAPQVMEVSNEKAAERKIPATKSRLQEFLEYNGITKESPDYKDYVESFYADNPDEPREEEQEECPCKEELLKLQKDEVDAIDAYSKAITLIMGLPELEDSKKRRMIARLKEIRADEEEHYKELAELLSITENKEEKLEEEQAL